MAEADKPKPAIIDSAIKAWRDAFAAFSAMPVLFVVAMLLLIAFNALSLWLMPADASKGFGAGLMLLSIVIGFLQGFIVTPLAIAVHRYVLLGEITPNYSLNPSEPRFMQFFVFTIVFQILMGIPSLVMAATGATSGSEDAGSLVGGLLGFLLFIFVAIAALRLLMLFPAIAVDAPGAQWRNAMADTKGRTWRVFFVMLVTSLPLFVVIGPLQYLFLSPGSRSLFGSVILALVQGILGTLVIAAYAAAASRLYHVFSAQLGRPPGLRIA